MNGFSQHAVEIAVVTAIAPTINLIQILNPLLHVENFEIW